MAFENVNYGMIPQSQMQQQSMLMQSIGQGIGNYQNQQQLDMQNRQLEMKANEKKDMDFEQIAMQAVYKKQMGAPTTPQEDAAIGVMAQTKSNQSYLDPNTGQMVTRDNPWRAIAGQEAQPQRMGNTGQGQGTNPALSSPYGAIAPQLTSESFPDMNVGDVESALGGAPQLPVQGNPLEQKDLRKANIDLQKKQAEMEMSEGIKQKYKAMDLKSFSDGNLVSAGFGNRMVESSNVIDGLSSDAGEGMTGILGGVAQALDILPLGDFGTSLGEVMVQAGATSDQQQYMNAAENWLSANLRKESGAAINSSEMAKEYKKYFPMPTDSGAVKEQKARMRKVTEKGMIGQSAGAYQKLFGKKGQALQEQNNSTISYEEYFK